MMRAIFASLAAAALAACGDQGEPRVLDLTGTWTLAMTESDGSTMCSGVAALRNADAYGSVEGTWSCNRPEDAVYGTWQGTLAGIVVGSDLHLTLHCVASPIPTAMAWRMDATVRDASTFSGSCALQDDAAHAGETYRISGARR